VLSIIEAAGWPIWLIVITSVIALAIIGERFWSLRTPLVAPRDVLPNTIREYQAKGVTQDLVNRLQRGPLIGRIFAAALVNERASREIIKDAVGMIAAEGRVTIVAELESVAIKDGIKAVCTLPKSSEQRHDLYDAQGKQVLIVVASAEAFLHGDMPRPDLDQPPLSEFE